MKSMAIIKSRRIRFYIGLTVFCCLYWAADSLWSYVSFEENLQVLIFAEPTSLFDTLLLRVSPYQVVSRLIAVALFAVGGTLLFESLTGKQRAEAALRESEVKYRALVNNANDAIFVFQHRTIKFANPKAVDLLGYSRKEMIGAPMDFAVHPDDRAMVVQRHVERISGGNPPSKYSIRIINKENEVRWVRVSTTLTRWDGEMAFLNFLADISEEKRLQEQLQRSEKMEAVGLLAGGVAHDLNNILSGLVSYPDLLLMDIPPDSPLRQPILIMQKSGKKAATIVQDLLTLARTGVNRVEVVNLNAIVEEYLASPEFAKLKTFHPRVDIEPGLAADLLNVLGSPVHLSKTVMNLVSNAAEACPGGGKVVISTANQYVDQPVKGYDEVRQGDYAVLQVRDTGEGIAPEDMKRIFEPFYTKKVMGRSGTGLGMAVVWGTVKDHHGYIDLESTPGRGTTLTIYFPVTRKVDRGKEDGSAMAALTGQGERILVVDDVEEQRLICSQILRKLGYAVHTVSSGEDAVTYLGSHPAELVVLDMIMDPGMDGLDTYRAILRLHPGQKAMVVSGFAETDRVEEIQRLGAGQYVRKPYTLKKIGAAVKAALGDG